MRVSPASRSFTALGETVLEPDRNGHPEQQRQVGNTEPPTSVSLIEVGRKQAVEGGACEAGWLGEAQTLTRHEEEKGPGERNT